MTQLVRDFLKDEDRASKIIIDGAVIVMVIAFVLAVAAIAFGK